MVYAYCLAVHSLEYGICDRKQTSVHQLQLGSKHSKGLHSYLEHCNRKKAAVGRKQLSTTDSNQGQRHRQTKGAYNEQLHARVNTGHAAANLQEKSAGYSDVVSRERRQPEDFPPWQFGFLGTGLLESLERPATDLSSQTCVVCLV